MEFTYYGDLLGISNYYSLGEKVAYKKLNDFYNETFSVLEDYVDKNNGNWVEIFSDSLFIVGVDAKNALQRLNRLYLNLLHKDLLLRGAIVSGKLSFEPRFTVEKFDKRLPEDDTLWRAVSLEKRYKGSRLIVENSLAHELFNVKPEWMTNEGYIKTKFSRVPHAELLRKICPTPNQQGYEMLYYWTTDIRPNDYKKRVQHLRGLAKMQDKSISIHLIETAKLVERSRLRYLETIDL